MANTCGLRTVANEPVPLKSMSVEVDVQGHVASVSSTLQYENQETSPVEAIFIFPMESKAAVYHFQARIGDVEIKAEVEKEQPELLSVWATVLAVLWLHGHKVDCKDEWQLVATKAISWIRAQSDLDLAAFVAAGNSFLGLKVERQNFGL